MNPARHALLFLPLLAASISSAFAADTCECADITDLMNRDYEEQAAITAYENAILNWGSAPPGAHESARLHLQGSTIQPALDAVTTSGTNKSGGNTGFNCRATIKPSTTCMEEVAAQHESVHIDACQKHRASSTLSWWERWTTLADYAREEIAAYKAEGAYVHATLVHLQRECQLQIEMKSDIYGTFETTHANATSKLDAAISTPDLLPSVPYRGQGTLSYNTKDTGPPKKVGNPLLTQLVAVCYSASTGSGKVAFDVVDGYLWRGNTPPFDPRLDLTFNVTDTGETLVHKGQRGCPKSKQKQPFWSEKFKLGKTVTTAPNHILIDQWTFNPRAGVFAEKVINSTCGPTVTPPGGHLAGLGSIGLCNETTTFTVTLKK